MKPSRLLSVIIITWNDADRLARCLRSLTHCRNEVDCEVIVVDDGSTDHTFEVLRNFPFARVVKNRRNLGMAPARNAAIRHASGKYLLFLDSDTEVTPGCFAAAVKALEADPACWIGGCKTFRSDGTLEHNAKRFYTLPTILLRRTVLGKWLPDALCLRRHLNQDRDHGDNFETDWVAGAALIVKRAALDQLGCFDARFRYYFDDYDLCYRARQQGGKVVYIPDSKVVHHLSVRSRKSIHAALRHLRSGIYFYLKTRGFVARLRSGDRGLPTPGAGM